MRAAGCFDRGGAERRASREERGVLEYGELTAQRVGGLAVVVRRTCERARAATEVVRVHAFVCTPEVC